MYIVAKSDHVLICRIYQLNQMPLSIDQFRNKLTVPVFSDVQLAGERSMGVVGHTLSRQIFLPVLTVFPARSLTYPVYLYKIFANNPVCAIVKFHLFISYLLKLELY
ncbi:TPA: hypothetical protein DCZ39_03860 [Patescibacteria group bacterium]|nr:hypothetical protein [Candidatus Gracilibacteria bacterium]